MQKGCTLGASGAQPGRKLALPSHIWRHGNSCVMQGLSESIGACLHAPSCSSALPGKPRTAWINSCLTCIRTMVSGIRGARAFLQHAQGSARTPGRRRFQAADECARRGRVGGCRLDDRLHLAALHAAVADLQAVLRPTLATLHPSSAGKKPQVRFAALHAAAAGSQAVLRHTLGDLHSSSAGQVCLTKSISMSG